MDLNEHLIAEILPKGEVSILAGASGAGKSTLLMHIIKCFQQSKDVFGHAIQTNIKIGYIAADRTWDAYARLAKVVGVDITKLYVRALIDDIEIDTEKLEENPQATMYALLDSMVKAKCDLVIVDPVVVLLGSDINTYHKVAARLIKLNRYCKLNNLTILGTHHANKARSDVQFKRAQDRISGTSALLGFTSCQLCLLPKEETKDQRFAEWHIVSHHAAPKVVYLDRDSATGCFIEASAALWDGSLDAPTPVDISMFEEYA